MSNQIKIFEILNVLDNLKHLKRTGWVRHNIPEPETVASHMYRMAVLAMILAEEVKNVDIIKCIKMALIHDIGEAIVGDITPKCGYSNESKFKLEEEALQKIKTFLPSSIGDEWLQLWLEYEAEESAEAQIVKQLDKIDMLAQALSYENKYGIDLNEFFESTKDIFKTQPFIKWDFDIRQKHIDICRKSKDL